MKLSHFDWKDFGIAVTSQLERKNSNTSEWHI